MTNKSVIIHLEEQIKKLISEHSKLVDLCNDLSQERQNLKIENRTLQEKINLSNKELSQLRLTNSLMGDSKDKDKARAQINQLMREIDKCIALVSK